MGYAAIYASLSASMRKGYVGVGMEDGGRLSKLLFLIMIKSCFSVAFLIKNKHLLVVRA